MNDCAIATRWSVPEIQNAIVRHTKNYDSIPNVSFGFFKHIECDLVQVSGAGYIHEFEIKRSWSDFLADFKKSHFHDDLRISQLTFVLPEALGNDRLNLFCQNNYREFKRYFDFMFYTESGDLCSITKSVPTIVSDCRVVYRPEKKFRTETYISPEMEEVIRSNDIDAPHRRHLFVEELAKLYRLGTIRFWYRQNSTLNKKGSAE